MKRRISKYQAIAPFRPLLKPITYWSRYRTTAAGKFVGAGFVISAGMGAGSLQIPIFQLFGALFGVLLIAWIMGLLLRAKGAVSGALPEKASAGQTVTGEFTFTNVSWRSARDMAAGFFRLPPSLREVGPGETIQEIPPGQSATLSVKLKALKRGHYDLPRLCAFTMFPFQLFRTTAKTDAKESSLLVLPSFHPIGEINVPLGRRYQPGGISLTSNIGESPEYIGAREYRAGDPLRRIDHRSWGRIGKPVVREYQEEYYCRIALILDTFVPAASRRSAAKHPLSERLRTFGFSRRGDAPPEGYPELEAAISLSAAVADALSRGEYLIDIFAAGPELYVFRAGRHTAHFENILEILSCIEDCKDNPFESLAPALSEELNNISTAICVFLDWDKTRQEFARAIAEAGCSLKIIVVREGGAPAVDVSDFSGGAISVYSPAEIQSGGIENL
ncbi:MAG: DUF58 domain-containing protein [Candidatus Sumerlaeota bacterium]|nr:DUF58 domain-containing protein [Candidatus Sumerlaeota bacterium]